MAADCAGQTLQLYRVVITEGEIASQGYLDGRNNVLIT